MSNYTWVSAFKAVSEWIAGYEKRQSELVQILRDIGVAKGLDDELSDGRKVPLTVIDPFTFFATFMKYGPTKRKELFSSLLKHIDLLVPAPSDFDGVPSAQPLKVWLFPYEKERKPNMVPNLWKLFHQMRSGAIDGELFNEILRIPHTGFAKLTQCLFYLSPEKYFPVDAQTTPWLVEQGKDIPKENWESYQDLLSWLAANANKPYYKISHEAWLGNQKKAFSANEADLYLSDRYEGSRSGTSHLLAFKTGGLRELAFDPGINPEKKKKIKLFVDEQRPGSISSNFDAYDADKSRNHHLNTHAPSLSQGNPAWAVEINNLDQLKALCDWYEGEQKDAPVMNETPKSKSNQALNQILYGPPGTGKTYATTELAVALADPEGYESSLALSVTEEEKRGGSTPFLRTV